MSDGSGALSAAAAAPGAAAAHRGSDSDTSEDTEQRRREFLEHLRKYMASRGTPLPSKMPMMNGKTIDLYTLFEVVQRQGGYNAVLQKRMWKTMANQVFGVPVSCSNAGYSLRVVYHRTLLPYERKYSVAESGAATPLPVPSTTAVAEDLCAGPAAAMDRDSAAQECGTTNSVVQSLGATTIIAPSADQHAAKHAAKRQRREQRSALDNTTYQQSVVPTLQNSRMTYRHYFEVSAMSIYSALQSGLDLQVTWALRTLLIKSFNGEVALEHVPGMLPLLLQRIAGFEPCSQEEQGRSQGVEDGARPQKRRRVDTTGNDSAGEDAGGDDEDIEDELDDVFALGSVRSTVLAVLLNLSQLAQNARDMALCPVLVEYVYHGLVAALPPEQQQQQQHQQLPRRSKVFTAGGTESWRLYLDMLGNVSPWLDLSEAHAAVPFCVRRGLLQLLVSTTYLFSDDDAVVCAATRALAHLAAQPSNERAFCELVEHGADERGVPVARRVPQRVAHIFVTGNAAQQQPALALLERLCKASAVFAAAAAHEPLLYRRLVSVVVEVAGTSPTLEELVMFQEVVERGKAAVTVIRCMLLAANSSDSQCMFAYESFFACLAASDSPLAQHASTVLAALVTASETVFS